MIDTLGALKGVMVDDYARGRRPLEAGDLGNKRFSRSLLLIGDSIEARLGDVPTAISAHYANIASIANNGGTVVITTSAAHGLSTGNVVYVSEGSASAFPTRSGITNRRFQIEVLTTTTLRLIGAPTDTATYTYASGAYPYITLDAAYSIQSSWAWTMFLLNHPFDAVFNRCIPGASSSHVVAALAGLWAIDPRYVGLCVGVNDYAQAVDPAVTIANIQAIVDGFLSRHATVIINTVTPQNSMTDTKNITLKQVNDAILDLASTRERVLVVDAYSELVDSSSSSGVLRSDVSADGTHPNGHGHFLVGRARARVIENRVPSLNRPAFYAGVNLSNYFTNGKMAGTGGTVTSTATGTLATSWTVGGSLLTANVSAAFRKQRGAAYGWIRSTAYAVGDVVKPTTPNGLMYVCTTAGTSNSSAPTWGTVAYGTTTDNTVTWTAFPMFEGRAGEEWQYFELGIGATVGSNEYMRMEQQVTIATAGLAVGDTIRGRCRIKMFDGLHMGFGLRLRSNTQVGGQFPSAWGLARPTFLNPAKAVYADGFEGYIVTPAWKIPAGCTILVCQLEVTMTTANMTCRGMVTDMVLERATETDPL